MTPKAYEIENIGKLDFVKIKKCAASRNIQESVKIPHECEKIFGSHTCGKGLVSRMH
jgi:hypothetical protein